MRDLARGVSEILGVVLVFLAGEMVLAKAEKLPSARNNRRAEAIERMLIVTWVLFQPHHAWGRARDLVLLGGKSEPSVGEFLLVCNSVNTRLPASLPRRFYKHGCSRRVAGKQIRHGFSQIRLISNL
jgi:hypothetical protein